MKVYSAIANILLTVVLVGCQSIDQITDNFLIGKWEASDISGADSVEVFGEILNMDIKDVPNLEFSIDEMNMDEVETRHYQFLAEDSTLTIYDRSGVEIIKLYILNENEFETKDNMGLVLKFQRIK